MANSKTELAATPNSAREEAKPSIQSLIRAHPAFEEAPPEWYSSVYGIATGQPQAKRTKPVLIPDLPNTREATLEEYRTVFLIATGRPPKPKKPA